MPLRPRVYVPPSLGALSHSLHPRAFQLRCRRFQSSSSKSLGGVSDSNDASSSDVPNLEPLRRTTTQAESDAAAYAQNPNLLLMQLQDAQRKAQKRKFETPTQAGRTKSPQEKDTSFHPVFVGFAAGLMTAFGLSYTIYHFSGSYHVQKASQAENKQLGEEQKRIATLATAEVAANAEAPELSAQEVTDWLRRATIYYSTYQPNSKAFVEARSQEIDEGLQHKDKAREVEDIAKACAVELEKEVGPRNLYQNFVSGLMTGRTGWHIIMKHLIKIEDAVVGRDFAEKRRARAAKGIIDEH